eukprot:TRINITY_DN27457_c0_g1_i1.p1 TRINITY_DN27457_c0_g1~~TRINITY_DN27457_c0_g1_i1.p1  ORF type:complete len:943 (+),score=114.82 TRINITY_DN27457_c0_g1_i1:22-2829(+)
MASSVMSVGITPPETREVTMRTCSSGRFVEALARVSAALTELTGAVGHLGDAHNAEVAHIVHEREALSESATSQRSVGSNDSLVYIKETMPTLINVMPEVSSCVDNIRTTNSTGGTRFGNSPVGGITMIGTSTCSDEERSSTLSVPHTAERYRHQGRKSVCAPSCKGPNKASVERRSDAGSNPQDVSSPKGLANPQGFSVRKEWSQDHHSRIVSFWQREINVIITSHESNEPGFASFQELKYGLRKRSCAGPPGEISPAPFLRCGENRETRFAFVWPSLVLHPGGYVRLVWNSISLITIAYDMFMIPLLAFEIGEGSFFSSVSILITVFWSLDVLLNFRTGYFIGNRLEMEPGRIARHYATTWFFVDLIVVATDFLGRFLSQIGTASLMRSSRFFRTMRFVRLLRVAKLKDLWRTVQEQINSNVISLCIRIAIMAMVIGVAIHVISCLWFHIGIESHNGWPSYDAFEGTKDKLFWYTASARWSIAQLNGRTDMDDRRSMPERGFTCIAGVGLAVIAKALFTSVLTKTMLDLSDLRSEKNRRRRIVNEYLDRHHLSAEFVASLKRCIYDFQDADKEQQQEEEVLSVLPRYMMANLLFEVRAPTLTKHVLFSAIDQISRSALRHICRSAVRAFATVKGEVIFDKFDPCGRMIIVIDGVVAYGQPTIPSVTMTSQNEDDFCEKLRDQAQDSADHGVAAVLHDAIVLRGQNFLSEAALWVEWFNKGRLVTESGSSCFAIDYADLAEVLSTHQDAFAASVVYGRGFVKHFSILEKPTDLTAFDVQIKPSSSGTESRLSITVVSARALRAADMIGASDPYVVCQVSGGPNHLYATSKNIGPRIGAVTSFKTNVVKNNCEPVWNHVSEVDCRHGQTIVFKVYDSDFPAPDELLGRAQITVSNIISSGGFDGELALHGDNSSGHLYVKVSLCPVASPTLSLDD